MRMYFHLQGEQGKDFDNVLPSPAALNHPTPNFCGALEAIVIEMENSTL